MQIVIDIPDEQYEYLSKIADAGQEPLGYFERVIMRGIPLPKGHGRLIDVAELNVALLIGELYGNKTAIQVIQEAPTIIEADKAESEDKE